MSMIGVLSRTHNLNTPSRILKIHAALIKHGKMGRIFLIFQEAACSDHG